LLEGKESRAHAMMDEFQFTGDTPALYYAQAAWEFQHNNPEKASDWTASANKIYSSALNSVFADAFYDVGWMQRPAAATMPTPAFDTAQAEGSPAVEPSPIPDKVFAANSQSDTSKGEGLALSSTVNAPGATGLDIAGTGTATQTSISASNESASGTGSQPEPPASALSSGGSESTIAASPAESPQTSPASTEGNGFVGGPRQISLQLKASKPALRHSAVPSRDLSGGLDLTKNMRAKPSRDSAYQMEKPIREVPLIGSEAEAEPVVGPVVEQAAENGESLHTETPQKPEKAAD